MSEITIVISQHVGEFGENKDKAKTVRTETIMPALQSGHDIMFDFIGVDGVTQSFIHALISDPIREYYPAIFDKLHFKNCNATVRAVIEVVYEYMREGLQ